jgi:hypothetical protein
MRKWRALASPLSGCIVSTPDVSLENSNNAMDLVFMPFNVAIDRWDCEMAGGVHRACKDCLLSAKIFPDLDSVCASKSFNASTRLF